MEISLKAWQNLGRTIIIRTCSSCLLILHKSPIIKKTSVYYASSDNLNFLNSVDFEKLADKFYLPVDMDLLRIRIFNRAKKIKKEKYDV